MYISFKSDCVVFATLTRVRTHKHQEMPKWTPRGPRHFSLQEKYPTELILPICVFIFPNQINVHS